MQSRFGCDDPLKLSGERLHVSGGERFHVSDVVFFPKETLLLMLDKTVIMIPLVQPLEVLTWWIVLIGPSLVVFSF